MKAAEDARTYISFSQQGPVQLLYLETTVPLSDATL